MGCIVDRVAKSRTRQERLSLHSLMPQMIKNLPAVQATRLQFIGWEVPLEKEMVTHSSILA